MTSRSLLVAMLSAAAITAEFVGGKATRDALFLTSLGASALPAMLIVTAFCSILLVALQLKAARKASPAVLVPASFAVSGVLFVLEWYCRPLAPSAVAVAVYLHVSGAGPLLASGFWLIASERFDPRTAKARFGQIAGAGTFGGLIGALLSERVAAGLGAPPMLLFLGGLQFLAAWLVSLLADPTGVKAVVAAPETAQSPSGMRATAHAPHLRDLMILVVLGTTSAALLEYLFKVRAVEVFGRGDQLLRFFAVYYAVTSLVSFVLQVLGSGAVLKRCGLALTTGSPSIAVVTGGLASLVWPGFGSLVVARATESVLRASWFRAGYELFFTPLQASERRAAKPMIDVALDRLGDAVGGGVVRLVVVLIPVAQSSVLLAVATACSMGAILAASHLNRWYLRTLEKSLVNQGGKVASEEADGLTARMISGVRRARVGKALAASDADALRRFAYAAPDDPATRAALAEVQDVLVLRFGDKDRVIRVLAQSDGVAPGLVPYVIPLLVRDDVADYAMFALRKVAEERVGALIDALLDPTRETAVRRQVARVLSVCVSQRAADGLLLALDDERFDVRIQAARSLLAIVEKNPRVSIDRARIEEIVHREVGTGLARQSLAHIFTLLSLVLPTEPLQIAFQSLNSPDRRLRGTAVEYLDEVLPTPIRALLWPFIAPSRTWVGQTGSLRRVSARPSAIQV
jgi:ATP:ADP antiporter, AAA family